MIQSRAAKSCTWGIPDLIHSGVKHFEASISLLPKSHIDSYSAQETGSMYPGGQSNPAANVHHRIPEQSCGLLDLLCFEVRDNISYIPKHRMCGESYLHKCGSQGNFPWGKCISVSPNMDGMVSRLSIVSRPDLQPTSRSPEMPAASQSFSSTSSSCSCRAGGFHVCNLQFTEAWNHT